MAPTLRSLSMPASESTGSILLPRRVRMLVHRPSSSFSVLLSFSSLCFMRSIDVSCILIAFHLPHLMRICFSSTSIP